MPASKHPFTVNIYFPDGTPDGYRIVSQAHWAGRCVICPQSLFPEKKKEPEFHKPGVYILVGSSSESDNKKIYIGEGDPVLDRIRIHYAEKDFWNQVIFFTSTSDGLTKGHIQYLESRLISLAREARQCDIENKNAPALPSLSSAESATTEVFLDEMLCCLGAMGIRFFTMPSHTHQKFLFVNVSGIIAKGYEVENGFVVCKGSQAVLKETSSFKTHTGNSVPRRVRKLIVKEGLLKPENGHYVFTKDYLFSSPSSAASVESATACNGLLIWKDEHGKTLKNIRAQQT